MRVCLICAEVFAWGQYGGFGRATRATGQALKDKGVDVSIVVPQRPGQDPVEDLDGLKVFAFPPTQPWKSRRLFRDIDADIYHSQQPGLTTWYAMCAVPHRRHVITFRDPRTLSDWIVELQNAPGNPLNVFPVWVWYENPYVRRAVRRADSLYCCAQFLVEKVCNKYQLDTEPGFLPTPVPVPARVQKSRLPTVCFNGRLDQVKNPARFLVLAKQFPEVQFIVTGHGHVPSKDRQIRDSAAQLPNVQLTGFLDQFRDERLSGVLERSWILVNTSAKEALPNAFIEASAHGCAILSEFDPDEFTSRFGCVVMNGDFVGGLRYLLQDRRWERRGSQGRKYVRAVFEQSKAIQSHLNVYQNLGVTLP